MNFCNKDKLVTFGVIPNTPETGYGYIEAENPLDKENIKGEKIKKFLEKPDLITAKKLIKDNHFAWNSGIFLFNSKVILDEINKYNPTITKFCKESLKQTFIDLDFQRLSKTFF